MKPRITVCLLNWRRPENLYSLLPRLRQQSEPLEIFLWDNDGTNDLHFAGTTWTVRSTQNKRCWPRWFMASQAASEYVVSWDDDLIPTDPHFMRDLVAEMDKAGERAVGIDGVIIRPGMGYRRSNEVGVHPSISGVDIIKGRVLAVPTRSLATLDMLAPKVTSEDDIAVSAHMANGKANQHNRVIHSLRKRVENLPAPHAISESPGHYERRDEAVKTFFRRG